ncbi:MAG: tRNA 2-thiouridine(34) synthase MnmA, partial [Proteobacteria bacterium]|nr:tRNA 2-thiouridine(34) synthase MnmA [Pseudomonadota bacterium]
IRCNQTVKFTDLAALARGLGAERLATGHYVRRIDGPEGPELHRAADPARDQSWFLFAMTREQLAFSLFPLGDMPDKAAVRAEAARLGIPVAAKPDSQDLCFVPGGDYAAVLAKLRPEALAPGEIVTADGAVVGRHNGAARYTVGQAKRLGPAAMLDGARQVVVATDPARRRVVIGPRGAGTRDVSLAEMHWLIDPPEALACDVKLRAREAPHPAVVRPAPDGAAVTLADPALPAPGQACVMYRGDRVLGGGFVRRSA